MIEGEDVPAGSLPLAARSPGKCIVFGEHAVVHGGPELVVAIDLYVQVGARAAPRPSLNGSTQSAEENPYFQEGLHRLWGTRPPIALTVTSRVPRSAGLGSSAAFCSAIAALLGSATGGLSRAHLAERAFEVERGAQGVGSPGDTSATVAGGYVALNAGAGASLWSVSDGERTWAVRRVSDPGWLWVVAYSGIPRNTAETVRTVSRRLSEPDGPGLLERFRTVALAGIEAIGEERREEVGRLLTENQRLLREVGVSHPRLEALLEAAAPASFGGKLTGAGAGGSIVVLPHPGREVEAVRRIARAGGVPFVVRVARLGAGLVPPATAGAVSGRSLPGDDPDDRAVR
ncbi:MAG: hypothetical protein L3J95_03395 [Thermoplasmata archaeon]|nr:hypothetical protein [Thermoplasmata archaeon]MCI4359452.1 hypothetical protein [Thermoplasmata archaeon]